MNIFNQFLIFILKTGNAMSISVKTNMNNGVELMLENFEGVISITFGMRVELPFFSWVL